MASAVSGVPVKAIYKLAREGLPKIFFVHHHSKLMRKLKAYRDTTKLVVEDPEVQSGAATFKGTRILVHTIADLLAQGADADELREDYPALTNRMLEVAPLYAKANPRRGRPRSPVWRGQTPGAETRGRRES